MSKLWCTCIHACTSLYCSRSRGVWGFGPLPPYVCYTANKKMHGMASLGRGRVVSFCLLICLFSIISKRKSPQRYCCLPSSSGLLSIGERNRFNSYFIFRRCHLRASLITSLFLLRPGPRSRRYLEESSKGQVGGERSGESSSRRTPSFHFICLILGNRI